MIAILITFGFVTPVVAVCVLVIALIIFGPGKLPELGKSLGSGIKEFKDATNEVEQKSASVTNSKNQIYLQNETKVKNNA